MESRFLDLKQRAIVQERNVNSRIFDPSESISSKRPQDKFEAKNCGSLHQSVESSTNQISSVISSKIPTKVRKMVENVSVNGALEKVRTKSDFSSPSVKRLKISTDKSASKKVSTKSKAVSALKQTFAKLYKVLSSYEKMHN